MTSTQSIFQTQLDVQTPIFAILLFIFCIGLYHSLFTNLLKKYLQELYFATKHFQSPLNRSIIYLLMISLPMILLTLISLFYNRSMIGIEISMTFDQLNILIVAGYICWIQESRHTPIRGMHFVRDTIFAIVFVSLFINFFYSRKNQLQESIPVVVIWIVYYLILTYFDSIQQFLMKILGLKESNNYNAKFLLTSKHNIPDFLEVKDLISEKQQQIQQELKDYHEILVNLQQNEEDQQILMNFAKLFLPIKKAYEIKEQMENEQSLKEIQDCWEEGSNCDSDRQQHQEQHIYKSPTWNQSSDGLGLYLKSTYTDDFINEGQQQEQPSFYEKLIKYAFYPIYCCSQAAGRLYYLSGYLGMILLIGSAFGISNSSTYFSSTINSLSIVSIIVSLCMIYPSARYCIQISSNNDYDFTNMFLQSMILKLFLFSIFLLVFNIFFSDDIQINDGAFMCLIVRGVLLLIYLGFMAVNRFATRFNNFKFFCAFVIVAQVTKVLAQNIYNGRSE